MTKKVASETEPDGVGQRKLEVVNETGIGHLRTLSPWLLMMMMMMMMMLMMMMMMMMRMMMMMMMMMMTKKGHQKFVDTSVQIFSYITKEYFYLRGIQESRWPRASKTLCTPLLTGIR